MYIMYVRAQLRSSGKMTRKDLYALGMHLAAETGARQLMRPDSTGQARADVEAGLYSASQSCHLNILV